ncbi:MAG: transporter [Elusimicrobia bacterium]|nr:transporter [Elusimicrobiota bacterium]
MRRLLAPLSVLLLSAADAFARAGGGGGYHGSSGGSYSGGSYSGGSSFSGGYSGSYTNGDAGWIVNFMIAHPFITLVVVAAVLYAYSRSNADARPLVLPGDEAPPSSALSEESSSRRAAALAKIRAADPAFDEDAFLKRAAAAFVSIQDAWSRQDMAKARAFVSDGVYERFARQIAEYKERGVRNRMSDVEVLKARALGYRSGRHYDAVFVAFDAAATDELVKLGTDEVVSGGPDSFTEVWTFLRRPGAKTGAGPGLIEGHCPSCGSPLPIADAAQCAACKAWVNSGEHDWVLVEITQASVWEFPDAELGVDGWDAASAADPGLSLEAVEDRTSVAFWRWLDARRRGDPAPLRGVSSEEFLKDLELDGSFERDAAVGAVETIAFERGGEWDRAHVKVSWEADLWERVPGGEPRFDAREQRAHYFVFRRKAGIQSDPKKGLRAARCPACGAPSEQPDAAACAYCGHPYNDGSVSWVLEGIVPFGVWRRPGS